jgi:hypothetical protein
LWVEGDGLGELIAIRLESPRHLAFGAIAERYLTVDFTGRRLVTLVETESTRWNDYLWNDGKGAYNVYRETIDFAAVESISVWLQNLPPHRETKCRLGDIQALPLAATAIKNPQLTVAGRTVSFPIELKPGSWIECTGPETASLRPQRRTSRQISPVGEGWLSLGVTDFNSSAIPVRTPTPRADNGVCRRTCIVLQSYSSFSQ